MSNTGHKGITKTHLKKNGCGELRLCYKIVVMWRGVRRAKIITDLEHDNPLRMAVEIRNELERQLGKPRTERFIRG